MSDARPVGVTTFVTNVCLPGGQVPEMAALGVHAEHSPDLTESSVQEESTAGLKSRFQIPVDSIDSVDSGDSDAAVRAL